MSGKKRPNTEVVDEEPETSNETKRPKQTEDNKPPVNYIPDGYHTLTSYIIVAPGKGKEALEYYQKVFNAKEILKFFGPDGSIHHAEVQIGNSRLMLGEECGMSKTKSPLALGGTGVGMCVYVEDVDKVFKEAIEAGGTETCAVKDQFYGDRSGSLIDPFGHLWTVSTHIEDVPHEEMQKRGKEEMEKEMGKCENKS